MEDKNLSPKAASKKIHKLNIWLSEKSKDALNKKIRELKLNNTPKSKSQIISETIENEFHSTPRNEGERNVFCNPTESIIHRTTVYLDPYTLQMIFDLEGYYYWIKRITPSKIIDAALYDYLVHYDIYNKES